VILDVRLKPNRRGGNHLGPMRVFKAVDNQSYYRFDARTIQPAPPSHRGTTWTSQVQALASTRASVGVLLALIRNRCATSYRKGHVDGFRFDLASALRASSTRVDRLSAFSKDPSGSGALAGEADYRGEQWDVGPGGLPGRETFRCYGSGTGCYSDVMRDFCRHRGTRHS